MASPTTDRRMGLVGNTAIKAPCACATTANITLYGEQSIDGVTTSASRVLVKNQTNTVQNGIYDSSSAAWTRSVDANGTYDLVGGSMVEVTGGSSQAGQFFVVTGSGVISPDSSAITFAPAALPVGSLAAQLASSSVGLGSKMIAFIRRMTGAVARWVEDKLSETITVDDFGAVGDGITDDTSAINTAEAACFAAGRPLHFVKGKTYVYTGAFQPRVEVYGYGATLKQNSGSVQATDTPGTLHLSSTTDVSVYGLTVDGNNKWAGITADGCTRLSFIKTTAKNCRIFGHAVLNSTEVLFSKCKSRTIAYRSTGAAGLSADGFYHAGCVDVKYVSCNASDFRRIGFVSEQAGAVKSDYVKYTSCDASNANNCDDSTTEYNAAFWVENTNNADLVQCTGRNLAGNAGQTSGRVWGIAIGLGDTVKNTKNITDCSVDGGSGNINIAYPTNGSGQLSTVNITNCFARKCASGISSTGGIDVFRIKGFKVDTINATASGGAVLFDIAASAINQIDIDGIDVTNGTFATDSAWINFFSGNANTIYTLRGMHGGTHVCHQQMARVTVDDSSVNYGSASYSSFLAQQELRFKGGFRATVRAGATKKLLFDSGNMTAGANVFFEPGSQIVESSFFQWGLSNSCNIYANGARFDSIGISIQLSGSFVTQLTDCQILNADATLGFLQSSAVAFTRWELYATNNRCTGGVPFRKSTGNPTYGHLLDNKYVNATLHDFTAGVTVANNLNTP